jgi:DNA-binding beta-propeller fold protein YncE
VQISVWGKEGSGKGQFQSPTSASQDRNGNVYVVDQGNHRIQIFKPDGTYITEFGQSELEKPFDIAILVPPSNGRTEDNEDHAYVTDLSSADIEVFKIIKSITHD